MRKIYRVLIMLFIMGLAAFPLFSQNRIEELMKLKPRVIAKYETTGRPHTIALNMDFNSPLILNPKDAEILKGKSILRVEMYYTQFKISETFSQPVLNKERYAELRKICPDLFKQSFAEWKITGQSGAANVKEAKNYFHGFVITYIPEPDKESVAAEARSISDKLNNDSLGHDTEYVSVQFKYRKLKKRSGLYLPLLKSKREDGVRYTKKGIWNRPVEYIIKVDTLVYKHKHKAFIRSKNAITFMRRMPDTTIFKVLERHANWKNILFVCDVTGSMSPYTTEILIWHKLNYRSDKAKYFTFFNDGDDLPDRKKKIGKTGGVYSITAGNYDAVEISLYNTMSKGGGGDAPENNCEAVIKSLQQMKDAEEIVMIADNWANIKDLDLAKTIKKPVRIILCGAESGFINIDYLELARVTKGSIHLMNEDLDDLAKLNEGAEFSFGKSLFKIVKGKIILYNPT